MTSIAYSRLSAALRGNHHRNAVAAPSPTPKIRFERCKRAHQALLWLEMAHGQLDD